LKSDGMGVELMLAALAKTGMMLTDEENTRSKVHG
jgi:hypothetical protein